MARCLTEEKVTKTIIKWLVKRGWEIIAFDFPQSGTGIALHPNNTTSKTEGIIIPDIIAYKNGVVLDFENKSKFVLDDFLKIDFLKNTKLYNSAYNKILSNHPYNIIYYGIGLPYNSNNYNKTFENIKYIDFVLFVNKDGDVIFDKKLCREGLFL